MSRLFKSYMGKNTFGVLKESQEAGKYTLNKKALASFCPPKICISKETQSNRLLLLYGQMAERSKALVLKTNIFNQYRRFKSYFVLL